MSQGVINFFDPARIRPVLNIDLQTVAKGVTVDLNVAGPMDDLKLTHSSDPPLQFNEIVALLATGRAPTSDPNIAAKQPSAPQQSMQQMGESALVSQAIANPLSSRLERVFGVSQLKIDPTFPSGSELPQARLTLQQQITSNLTFTYITNVQQPDLGDHPHRMGAEPAVVGHCDTGRDRGGLGSTFSLRRRFDSAAGGLAQPELERGRNSSRAVCR